MGAICSSFLTIFKDDFALLDLNWWYLWLTIIFFISQDKVIGLLAKANPNQANQPDDGTPWYFKYGSRALGIIGAFCTWQINYIFIIPLIRFISFYSLRYLFGNVLKFSNTILIKCSFIDFSLRPFRIMELSINSICSSDVFSLWNIASSGRLHRDGNWSSFLLHVHRSCTNNVTENWRKTTVESSGTLLHVSLGNISCRKHKNSPWDCQNENLL